MTVSNSQLNGLLVVDKPGRRLLRDRQDAAHAAASSPADLSDPDDPYLLTSHDVVRRVRKWSNQRRIGHTGTLDPLASGVLVLCLGNATRLVEYYQGETKQYLAEIRLGQGSDSYDALGNVSAPVPIPPLRAADIDRSLDSFRGEIMQRPPVFAAIKQGGEALYAKARRGEQVVVEARRVTFYEIVLLEYLPPDYIALRIRCSAGAYIRSLAHELGLALNTHALLTGLRREAAGGFTLADAHKMAAIQEDAAAARLPALLLPPGERLPLPAITPDAEALRRLSYGQSILLPDQDGAVDAQHVQVRDLKGQLVGIARRLPLSGADADVPGVRCWRAEKWLI